MYFCSLYMHSKTTKPILWKIQIRKFFFLQKYKIFGPGQVDGGIYIYYVIIYIYTRNLIYSFDNIYTNTRHIRTTDHRRVGNERGARLCERVWNFRKLFSARARAPLPAGRVD